MASGHHECTVATSPHCAAVERFNYESSEPVIAAKRAEADTAAADAAAALAARSKLPFQKGIAWGHGKTSFFNHLNDYTDADASRSMETLADTGADWVQVRHER